MELRAPEQSSSFERGEAEMSTSEVTGTKGEGSGASLILLLEKRIYERFSHFSKHGNFLSTSSYALAGPRKKTKKIFVVRRSITKRFKFLFFFCLYGEILLL